MTILYPNVFVILALAAAAGLLLFYPALRKQEGSTPENKPYKLTDAHKSNQLKEALALAAAIALLAYGASLQPVLLKLGWVFFRMGALVFGNGFTMIPLIQQEVVDHYHWLTMDEFAVGLGLGQVTPGPVLITATFIGYKVASLSGAAAATLGIFLPSLFLVMLTAEMHRKIKHNPWVKAAEKGIVASFVGMMLVVLAGLARHSLVDATTAALAGSAFLVLRLTKLDMLWVVTGGALLYLLIARVI